MTTTHVGPLHLHWPHLAARRLALALVALGVAFGAGVLLGRSSNESGQPQGLASEEAAAVIDGSLAALRRGDFAAFETYLSPGFVYDEPAMGFKAVRDREKILDLSEGYYNLGARYYRVSPVIQRGDLAAYVVSCPACPGAWSGIDLVQFDEHMKVSHLWTGNTARPLVLAEGDRG